MRVSWQAQWLNLSREDTRGNFSCRYSGREFNSRRLHHFPRLYNGLPDRMLMKNKVFIATSLDNYISDEHGGIEWLTDMPNPSSGDAGFSKFMESVDGIVMGRNTFEKVLSLGVDWPYTKKVFVWSSTLKQIPSRLDGKVDLVRGNVNEIVQELGQKQFLNLYIDGGKTIQSFLKENLIHEIIITQIPIILGRGISLFKDVPRTKLHHKSTVIFDNGMIQTHYLVIN